MAARVYAIGIALILFTGLGINQAYATPQAIGQTVSVEKNNSIQIQLQGTNDIPFQTIQFIIVGSLSNGSFSNFNNQEGTITYTPSLDFIGTDSFRFRVIMDGIGSAPATVTINVVESGGPEPITPQAYNQKITVEKNKTKEIKLEATGGEDNELSRFIIMGKPPNGELSNINRVEGKATYIPNGDFVGTDSFRFRLVVPTEQGDILSNVGIVTINVEVEAEGVGDNEAEVEGSLEGAGVNPTVVSGMVECNSAILDALLEETGGRIPETNLASAYLSDGNRLVDRYHDLYPFGSGSLMAALRAIAYSDVSDEWNSLSDMQKAWLVLHMIYDFSEDQHELADSFTTKEIVVDEGSGKTIVLLLDKQ